MTKRGELKRMDSEWPGKDCVLVLSINYVISCNHVEFLRRFKPVASCRKRPVGHPKKMTTSVSDIPSVSRSSIESCTSVGDMPAVSRSSIEATTSPTIILSSDEHETDPPLKKQRGQYQTYSLQFKKIVVNELHQVGAEIGEVGERFHVPRVYSFWLEQTIKQQG